MFRKTKPHGFRKWIELENLKNNLLEATETDEFPDRVYAYLSVALDIPAKKLEKQSWVDTVLSLVKAYQEWLPDNSLPLLKGTSKDAKPVDWDYPQRSWSYYSHILSRAYGWTLEYIASLDVNEALSRVQEILTNEQLDREFVYSLSEVAYPYNKSSKKSYFKPMKRPYWMLPAVQPIRKMKIKRSLLPVGAGLDLSGLPDEYGIKNMINSGQ